MMKIDFSKDFWWGAATSGPQSEGRFNKPHANVFDHWYEVEPDAFYAQVGPDTASNFYNSYKEDIAMMKEIGLNSFRTSIQWTRPIDDLEQGRSMRMRSVSTMPSSMNVWLKASNRL